ncbi:ABC-type transport auxiliary lipoprotein family protein [Erythrobacter rubeus]|uniref:Membrane integrity-associated transporter subunit PqiC n=1 Tax=Erythrobacter rubeus TaxID=2760803 RepID=A0ABR8KPD9_9SPHN|nr:ABC-type transport auxiliary lipoprotein family protein [Erythrobacter rubeus]MBD2842588.1 membrane integrity-associated transporter subunit PqiC [Erythrobacter rubeus]
MKFPRSAMTRLVKSSAIGAAALAVTGCISLGSEPPESLLTLSPSVSAEAGSGAGASTADASTAISILPLEAPAKLDALRVPVAVSATELAYLQDAFWVEKPARLFRRLLGETLRARGGTLVLDNDDTPLLAAQSLRGTLMEMGYDASSSSAIVQFDAIRTQEDGSVTSRRFEARETGVLPEPGSVGPALNRAANTVADEVAVWVTGAS